jgi:phage I-like protein
MKSDTHILNQMTGLHDGWMHVCPLGEHVWRSADGQETIVQVIDKSACEAMANAYPLSVQESMIDWEHESMSADGKTQAAGWGKEAQVREDGLWVRAEWSDEGATAVNGKRFKFNSPCFTREGLVHLEGNRYRVTQLGRIALTNNPNLRGQKPLTNSRPATAANPNKNMEYKTTLLQILGLPADASDDQIANGCTAQVAEREKMGAMNTRISELETQLANTDLAAHGITDEGQKKLFTPLLMNKATREETLKTLAALKGKAAAPSQIHNRQGAPVPGTDKELSKGGEEGGEDAGTKASNTLHNRAIRYRDAHKVSYEHALGVCRADDSAQ